ncbi:MAG: hypothetical protein WBM02_06790 [bacterium]
MKKHALYTLIALSILVICFEGCETRPEHPKMSAEWRSLDNSGLIEVRHLLYVPETQSILAGGIPKEDMSGISRYDLSREDWATPPAEAPLNCQVSWMSKQNDGIWASFFKTSDSPGALRVSHDNGMVFSEEIPLPEDSDPRCFLVGGEESSHILLGTVNAGIYISDDRGETWRQPQTPISDTNIQCFAGNKIRPGHILAGTLASGLWETFDGGENWASISSRIPAVDFLVVDVSAHPLKDDCFVCIYRSQGEAFVTITTDGAKTWKPIQEGFYSDTQPRCIAFHPSKPETMFAGTVMDGVYQTDNLGETWYPINNGLPLKNTLIIAHRLMAVGQDNPSLYAGLNYQGFVYKLKL